MPVEHEETPIYIGDLQALRGEGLIEMSYDEHSNDLSWVQVTPRGFAYADYMVEVWNQQRPC